VLGIGSMVSSKWMVVALLEEELWLPLWEEEAFPFPFPLLLWLWLWLWDLSRRSSLELELLELRVMIWLLCAL